MLIVKPCCIGDVLMASPLVAAAKAEWPAVELHWAADRHSHDAAAGIPGVDVVIGADGCVPGAFSLPGLFRLAVVARAAAYDVAIVPDRSRVLGAVTWLAKIPVRAGIDSGGRGRFHTHRVTPDVASERALFAAVGRSIGLRPDPDRPRFQPADPELQMAEWLLPGDKLRVALHPGGGVNPGLALVEKRWPAERYAAIATRLVAERGAQVVLLGSGPSDRQAADGVMAALPSAMRDAAARAAAEAPVVDLCGDLTLGLTAAVIARSRAYLGNDSGIAHLAAAVGTPAVVIFGPTDPARYGPPPGRGVAVAPPSTDPVRSLAAARGSRAIEGVSEDAVWEALVPLV